MYIVATENHSEFVLSYPHARLTQSTNMHQYNTSERSKSDKSHAINKPAYVQSPLTRNSVFGIFINTACNTYTTNAVKIVVKFRAECESR